MKFGKLADITKVDFNLPPDAAITKRILHTDASPKALRNAYVGCTGWSMKEWVGKVYPPATKTKDYLLFYGKQFNTIELNTTHYRIPTSTTIEQWRTSVPNDFRYCPKIPQSISHSKNLGLNEGYTAAFCDAIQGLDNKLGSCFMQLPPYFGFDRLGMLQVFLQNFPPNIPLAIEVRHQSWFEKDTNLAALFDLLEQFQVATVITDVAGRRDVLHQGLTTTSAMVRFVGNALHSSDYQRIDDWVERIAAWLEKGLKNIYFFTHEPDNILAPDLALYLVEKLQKLDGLQVRGPQFYNNSTQISLF